MSQGFLCILYRSKGPEAKIHGQTPREVWKACLMMAVKSFRFNNPDAPLSVFDIHDRLSENEKDILRKMAALKTGAELEPHGYGFDTFNKIIALQNSPFRETCIFDLDILFTGDLGPVFKRVEHDIGVLDYPNYLRTKNRINTGVLVVRNRKVLDTLYRERRHLGSGMTEEELIDQCLTRGLFSASKLPDAYGKSKQMWWAKTRDDITRSCASQWVGPLAIDWARPKPEFRLGDEIVRAWHFSSAKEKMVDDPLAKKYMNVVEQWLMEKR